MNWEVYSQIIADAANAQSQEASDAVLNNASKWLKCELATSNMEIAGSRERLGIIERSMMVWLPICSAATFLAIPIINAVDPHSAAYLPVPLSPLALLLITYLRLKASEKRQSRSIAACRKEFGYE